MFPNLDFNYIMQQEAMESFAFPDKINSSAEIPQKCSKLLFFSLES